jgi:hypothetical protein
LDGEPDCDGALGARGLSHVHAEDLITGKVMHVYDGSCPRMYGRPMRPILDEKQGSPGPGSRLPSELVGLELWTRGLAADAVLGGIPVKKLDPARPSESTAHFTLASISPSKCVALPYSLSSCATGAQLALMATITATEIQRTAMVVTTDAVFVVAILRSRRMV